MDLKTIIQSKGYMILALALSAAAILFLTFGAGMYVGLHKARFSYKWGENYQKNFTGPRKGILPGVLHDFGGKDLIDSNGAAGQVIKISGSTLVIKGRDNTEKIIAIDKNTIIMHFKENVELSDIKNNDFIVVIGDPNDNGQIEAKFIRILPSQATSTMMFWDVK